MGKRRIIRAAAVVDGSTVAAAPGVLLMHGSEVVAVGSPETVGRVSDADVIDVSGVLVPALVNVHAHLDLTSLGPQPRAGSFVDWIKGIRASRLGTTDAGIAESVRQGVELSRRGGTALIGDIAGNGSNVPVQMLRKTGLAGVSYIEIFGLGSRQQQAIERLVDLVDNQPRDVEGVRLGVQPHAPYSCGPAVYRAAAALGLPLATHLAETMEEVDFTASGSGPLVQFLHEIGLWEDSIEIAGRHPVDAVLEAVDNLSIEPLLAVHLNYVGGSQIASLAARNVHVAYCPRASEYFGHSGHRYRDLLDAGVNVALGTDSIVCLDTPRRLSVLDEMRRLRERDGTDARTLLRMATTNGARALGFDESLFAFTPGPIAGVLALEVDPGDHRAKGSAAELLRSAIAYAQDPEWIVDSAQIKADARP